MNELSAASVQRAKKKQNNNRKIIWYMHELAQATVMWILCLISHSKCASRKHRSAMNEWQQRKMNYGVIIRGRYP